MKYKWLLFDADDTLFDFSKAELYALKKTLKSYGLKYCIELHNRYKQISNKLFSDLEQGIITSSELNIKRFQLLFSEYRMNIEVSTFAEAYLENLADGSMLIPGTKDTIQALYPEFKMIIVTNGFSKVQRTRFANSEIKQYFNDIVISDEIGVAKPSREFFDIVHKKIGSPKKDTILIIGDSIASDMTGGVNFGIDTCWFNPHKKEKKSRIAISYEISKLHELMKILKTHNE